MCLKTAPGSNEATGVHTIRSLYRGAHIVSHMTGRKGQFVEKLELYREYVDGEVERAEAKERIGDDWDEVVIHARSESLRENQDNVNDEEVADLFR